MASLSPHPDSRVSALNAASVRLLRSMGAWRALAPAGAPFADLQVWAAAGGGHVRCDAASVGAGEAGGEARCTCCCRAIVSASAACQQILPPLLINCADALGFVVEDALAAAALHQRLRSCTSVRLMAPAAAAVLPPYSPVAQARRAAAACAGWEQEVQLQAELWPSAHA